ncbi:MAG TPA: uracil-DNA glycosylase, partial [Candidatus Aenigmarchaeota archaeon]|nr:uracil-DNA glycosylase [Candidatus Aenigmarchaeota archaeon]HEX32788.1 uracil-DNA glycosylase [Candidatus Aenigmarchaeota archaeon]
DPTEEEIRACLPYLEEQIRKINPRVIVMLGRHASSTIMDRYNIKFNGISQDHGKVFKISSLFGVKKLIPMYHPAAALYNPSLKEELKKDFKVIADELRPEYKNEQAK